MSVEFKSGDWVRFLYEGVYHYGEVTIVKETECKVLFNELNYDYYPKAKLEIIRPEDVKDSDRM